MALSSFSFLLPWMLAIPLTRQVCCREAGDHSPGRPNLRRQIVGSAKFAATLANTHPVAVAVPARVSSGCKRQVHLKFIWLMLLPIFFHCGVGTTTTLLAQQEVDPAVISKITTYLHSLDALQYQERELGLQGLASMGASAIRPLAVKIVTGSPESAWRSKQALETIGIRGDEETFLKTACVLQLLFIGANETLTQRISDLEIQWRLEQKRTILTHLKSRGARVIDSSEQVAGNEGDLILWNAIQDRALPDSNENLDRNRLTATKVSAKRPTVEALREVDKILDAAVDDNRRRLFGTSDRDSTKQETEIAPEILMELQLQRRFGVPFRGQLVGRNQRFPFAGISVVLDQQWKGGVQDLRRAMELSEFRRVEIERIDLSKEEFQVLSEIPSIVSVRLTGDEIDSERWKEIAEFKKIQELEVFDRTLQIGELAALEQLPSLVGLTFKNCQLSEAVVEELKSAKRLNSLALIEMKISPEIMESFGAIPNLRQLNLELCKFQIDSYRTLKASRLELEIGFTPQALLGIRGPMDLSNSGCEISQVVPNSGADLGGMKPGDVVLKINGQPVEDFEDLRLHVAQHQAGDVLSLVVRRNDAEVELKVQLTPFEEID